MNNLETAQFTNGAGGITPAELSLLIATTLVLLCLLWAAWVVYGQYKQWANGNLEVPGLVIQFIRVIVAVLLITFLVG